MRSSLLIMLTGSKLFSSAIVMDSETNLMWQDNSDAKVTKATWVEAKNYCEELNLAKYSDWRLPSIKELQSIVYVGRSTSVIKENFRNIAPDSYWSFSENASNSNYVWIVGFDIGATKYQAKQYKSNIRCVRDIKQDTKKREE